MNFKILLIIFVLTSCSTPYQKLDSRGGYSDKKIGENIYRVSFQGNTRTKDNMVYKYFLRRSAELALEKGYKYFSIIETEDKSKTVVNFQEGTPKTKKALTTIAYSGEKEYTPSVQKNVVKHIIEGQIVLFNENNAPKDAFKAEEVLKSIIK